MDWEMMAALRKDRSAKKTAGVCVNLAFLAASLSLFRPPGDPSAQTGSICVRFFHDRNGDQAENEGEEFLPDGAFILEGVRYEVTDPSGVTCVEEVAAGSVTVEGIAPPDYHLALGRQREVLTLPGHQVEIAFGAIEEGAAPELPSPVDEPAYSQTGLVVMDSGRAGDNGETWFELALRYSAIIVLGLAGVVAVVGMSAILFFRRV